jgi:hypothetical protein
MPTLQCTATAPSRKSLRDVLYNGLTSYLVPRLSTVAREELDEVNSMLESFTLEAGDDIRRSPSLAIVASCGP